MTTKRSSAQKIDYQRSVIRQNYDGYMSMVPIVQICHRQYTDHYYFCCCERSKSVDHYEKKKNTDDWLRTMKRSLKPFAITETTIQHCPRVQSKLKKMMDLVVVPYCCYCCQHRWIIIPWHTLDNVSLLPSTHPASFYVTFVSLDDGCIFLLSCMLNMEVNHLPPRSSSSSSSSLPFLSCCCYIVHRL